MPHETHNKNKLENTVLDQIQRYVLSRNNVKRYIELAMAQARAANATPTPAEAGNTLAGDDAPARLRRWEDTLERGLLFPEDAARCIKEIRAELDALLSRRNHLDQQQQLKTKILPIPTQLTVG